MNKDNTFLGQLLPLVSRSQFYNLIIVHKSEKGTKDFASRNQFYAMFFDN